MTGARCYARAPHAARDQLAELRDVDGLLVASDAAWLWLALPELPEPPLRHRLLGVCGLQLLLTTDDPPRGLRREGDRLATARLPGLDWLPLHAALPLRPERAEVPPPPPPAATPTLVRLPADAPIQEPRALLLEWRDLLTWGLAPTTPAFRLAPLRFALRRDACAALVIGTPLPPLPGRPLAIDHAVARPLGFGLRPALPHRLLARAFGLQTGDLLLFEPDRPLPAHIPAAQIVPLDRAGLRATRHALESPS